MKLLRYKERFEGDIQKFHLVEKAEWRKQEKWFEKMLNFHVKTFCSDDKIMAKGDKYVTFDRALHTKKICLDCYKMFKLKRK